MSPNAVSAAATTRSTAAFPVWGTDQLDEAVRPTKMHVEEGAGLAQHFVGDVDLQVDRALLHGAVGEDDDQQGHPRRQPDDLDGADAWPSRARARPRRRHRR